jgi:type VI secretion system protein ImpK
VSRRRGFLALTLQEALTIAARLRVGREVATDGAAFRARMKQILATADGEARRAGYDGADVKFAVYAFVALLDEAVLNSPHPAFTDWPRKPLQEEVFGSHLGGEVFFENLGELLARPDSDDTADVLEVHLLCLLLGFRGRYSAGGAGEIHSLMLQASEKVGRIRRGPRTLSPHVGLPQEEVTRARDPWLPRLQWTAVAAVGLALLLFAVYLLSLRSRLGALEDLIA